MMRNRNDIYYVGTLQDLGLPYTLLYVDKKERRLYIFARESEGKEMRYVVKEVSSGEVESYMNENIGLVSIFSKGDFWYATINGGKVAFDDSIQCNFTPNDRMKRMDMFDPDLCDDDAWLETFLYRINNNKPLEIA